MSKFFIGLFLVIIIIAGLFAFYSLHIPYDKVIEVPEKTPLSIPKTRVKILLVPGHDNLDVGTTFNRINEELLTRKLAGEIFDLFSKDDDFDVKITRDIETGDYISEFKIYFDEQKTAISEFKNYLKKDMKEKIKNGNVEIDEPIVAHTTSTRASDILYGINMWANENDVDFVLHVHFNNYQRSQMSKAGAYSGYSIYVPEHQYNNATSSLAIASSIENELKTSFNPSTLPIEKDTIIESQGLIAVGANNSRNKASILVEYGYIYEPDISKDETLQKMAELTYNGIKNYFAGQ